MPLFTFIFRLNVLIYRYISMKELKDLAFLGALGHPVRQKIILILREGDLPVCKLVEKLQLAQATVSHHLSILKKSGLVKCQCKGTCSIYSVCCEKICLYCQDLQSAFQ